jgi:hypothetical protein
VFKNFTISEFISLDINNKYKNNSTLFQLPSFINYHKDKFENIVMVYFLKDEPVAYITVNKNEKYLYSHQGSTYGGFVQLKTLSSKECIDVIKSFLSQITELKIEKFYVRFSPKIFLNYDLSLLNETFKGYLTFNYDEELTYVNLHNFSETNLKKSNFSRNHIRDINRFSENKNIKITEVDSNNLDLYYDILLKNLKKFNQSPTHTKTELLYLLNNFRNNVQINLLSVGDQHIAGLTKFILNSSTVHIFYGSLNYNLIEEYKGALKYLYKYEIQNAKKNGFDYFNFGVDVHYGNEPNDTLRKFKLGFGGINTVRSSYFYEL